MDIPVHGDGYAGMSQNLAETFYVKPQFNASGGKSMPCGMEIGVLDVAGRKDFLKSVLHGSGLQIPSGVPGEKEGSRGVEIFQKAHDGFRQGNGADRAGAFGLEDFHFGAPAF